LLDAYDPANLLNELGGQYDPKVHQGLFEEEEEPAAPAAASSAASSTMSVDRYNSESGSDYDSDISYDDDTVDTSSNRSLSRSSSRKNVSRKNSRMLSDERDIQEFEVIGDELPRAKSSSSAARSRVRITGIKGLQNITSLDEIKVNHTAHRSATLAEQDKQRLLRLELARRTLPLSVEAFFYLFFSEHSNFMQILVEELEFKGTHTRTHAHISA
jgi:hypothetical protein